jgi:LmbE family N-acetylglucosaminyl deacetylase
MGGALALAAQLGVQVHILCATRGEGGRSADATLVSPGMVGAVRADELSASCRVLGAQPPRFLPYADGGLAQVHLPDAVGEIVRIIREVQPQVVITLGADGVYGHPDHIALHKLVTPAFRSAGGGSRFPDEVYGPSWQPSRLLWTAYPRGLFRPQWEHMLRSEHAGAIRQINPDRIGVDPAEFAVTVDIGSVSRVKLDAIRCHRSQLSDGDPRSLFPPGIVPLLLGVEYYQHGEGIQPPSGATDLFAGLE